MTTNRDSREPAARAGRPLGQSPAQEDVHAHSTGGRHGTRRTHHRGLRRSRGRVRRPRRRERHDPAPTNDHARRVPRRRRALRDVVRVHRRGQRGRLDHPAAGRADGRRARRQLDVATARARGRTARSRTSAAAADSREREDGAVVLYQTQIDALEITILQGGGTEVGKWAIDHGFLLTPDAPEVLDYYSQRSPIFMAARFDAAAANAARSELGRRHADPAHDPDGPSVGSACASSASASNPIDSCRPMCSCSPTTVPSSWPAVAASSSNAASPRRRNCSTIFGRTRTWAGCPHAVALVPEGRRHRRRPALRPRHIGRPQPAPVAGRGRAHEDRPERGRNDVPLPDAGRLGLVGPRLVARRLRHDGEPWRIAAITLLRRRRLADAAARRERPKHETRRRPARPCVVAAVALGRDRHRRGPRQQQGLRPANKVLGPGEVTVDDDDPSQPLPA